MFQIDNKLVKVSLGSVKDEISKKNIRDIIQNLSTKEQDFQGNLFALLDASSVAGMSHLKACIYYALQAFKQQSNLAKILNSEILLYLSGYRQISRAIEVVGISSQTRNFLFVQIASIDDGFAKFDIRSFLLNSEVSVIQFNEDIEQFPIFDEEKLKSNLGITEEEIMTFISNSTNREEVIKNLAIEKSALLNLLK